MRDLDPKSYIDLKNMVIDRYNMSAKDAAKIISALDSVGACSYAEIANELFTFFKDIPDEFEKYFGFPLYVEGENGLININDKELLLDMYIFINSEVNGGYLIGTDKSGNNYIKSGMIDGMFGRYWLKSENAQRYMSGADGVNAILVNKYLKSKGYPGRYTTEVINSVDENVEINALKSEIKQSMESGEAVSIGLRSKTDRPINFVDIDKGEIYNNTLSWGEGSGHAVCVTGVREDGIVISSWGKKFLLMDSDLDGKAAYRTSKSRIIDVNINARRLKWFWEK